MIGIYKITNLVTNMSYIGQSINIQQRWREEKKRAFLENDSSYNYPLSRAFRKYGIDNFTFEVIEECSQEQLNDREKYWITYFDTFYNGYNQTLGGDSMIQRPKEKILGIIYDLEHTNMYHREIAEKWEISTEMVQGINTGRYWYQENKNYPLQKQHKIGSQHIVKGQSLKKQNVCKKCGKTISSKAVLCVECSHEASRKVEHPTAEELLQYLISIKGNFKEASRHYGVSDNAIRKWCKKYNIPSASKDYK